jgi:hypothetical protein
MTHRHHRDPTNTTARLAGARKDRHVEFEIEAGSVQVHPAPAG